MVHNSYIFININSWHTAHTIKNWNFFFLFFFFLFVSFFPLFLLLLNEFLETSRNSDQNIVSWLQGSYERFRISGRFVQFIKEAVLLIIFYLLYFLFFCRNFWLFFLSVLKCLKNWFFTNNTSGDFLYHN